ncbi:hypothetical protein [uncultured Jatrophihabitans sp.]|uniref:hypothetical protein n=1 Tax=uncultured Jatrophihabitans sp. TaxID=1610747 RepID=UPI0035CC195A
MDGEPLGMSTSALDAHLSSCPVCKQWVEQATNLTRTARLDATPVPDLADQIVADVVLPARRVHRRRTLLRVALFVTGLVQLGIGLPALVGDSIGMAMSMHGAHEMAAWDLATAAAFVAAAWLPRRAAGLVPLLATFLAILSVLSVRDIVTGAVGPDRLATHLAALAGLVLLVFLDRTERAIQPSPAQAVHTHVDDGPTDLRTVA